MMKLLFACIVACMIAVAAAGKEERSPESSCLTRVPQIEVGEAVKIAIDAASKLQASESSYVDFVSLECEEKKQYWVVGFRKRAYETGHLLVYVYMDTKTEISVVKDG